MPDGKSFFECAQPDEPEAGVATGCPAIKIEKRWRVSALAALSEA